MPFASAGVAGMTRALARELGSRNITVNCIAPGFIDTDMTAELPEPYLRWCEGCGATHMYEMTFRLAALHAGLELEPETSPPVVRRIPRWPAGQVGVLDTPADGDDGPLDDPRPRPAAGGLPRGERWHLP